MTSSSPVDNILKYFGELVNEFEQVLDKKAAAKPAGQTYTVIKGDVLWAIADKFDTTTAKLVELNDLKNVNFILEGQTLVVPAVTK